MIISVKKNKTIIINWKMYNSFLESINLTTRIIDKFDYKNANVILVIVPDFISIKSVSLLLLGTDIKVGAQNISYSGFGAYTGEICGDILREIGVDYIIIGHCERKILFGESDRQVNLRMSSTLNCGATPILCVGETITELNLNKTKKVIETQLNNAFDGLPCYDINVIIAYEPVWSVGTNTNATNEHIFYVNNFIKSWINCNFDSGILRSYRVIYGGSVNINNIKILSKIDNVDGFLIGRDSLCIDNLLTVIDVVNSM